jgi:hypothetical protein
MIAGLKLGATYVKLIWGPPPTGCKVGLMRHEHDLESHATVGLYYGSECMDEEVCEYLSKSRHQVARHWHGFGTIGQLTR